MFCVSKHLPSFICLCQSLCKQTNRRLCLYPSEKDNVPKRHVHCNVIFNLPIDKKVEGETKINISKLINLHSINWWAIFGVDVCIHNTHKFKTHFRYEYKFHVCKWSIDRPKYIKLHAKNNINRNLLINKNVWSIWLRQMYILHII